MFLYTICLRFEVTGIKEEHLRDAMPLKEVQEQILQILYNRESVENLRWAGGQAKVLVGHNLERDLDCLRMSYPDLLLRLIQSKLLEFHMSRKFSP